MSAIQALSEDHLKEVAEYGNLIDKLNSLVSKESDEKQISKLISECTLKVNKIRKARKNLSLELTQLKDRNERAMYVSKAKHFDEQVAAYNEDLERARNHQNKLELTKGATNLKNPMILEGKDNDDYLLGKQ